MRIPTLERAEKLSELCAIASRDAALKVARAKADRLFARGAQSELLGFAHARASLHRLSRKRIPCTLPNTETGCMGGTCRTSHCAPGHCEGEAENGCEVAAQTCKPKPAAAH
jgi:hypothetical protein